MSVVQWPVFATSLATSTALLSSVGRMPDPGLKVLVPFSDMCMFSGVFFFLSVCVLCLFVLPCFPSFRASFTVQGATRTFNRPRWGTTYMAVSTVSSLMVPFTFTLYE